MTRAINTAILAIVGFVGCGRDSTGPPLLRCPSADVALCSSPGAGQSIALALADSRERIVPALASANSTALRNALASAEGAVLEGNVTKARQYSREIEAAVEVARAASPTDRPDLDVIALAAIHLNILIY